MTLDDVVTMLLAEAISEAMSRSEKRPAVAPWAGLWWLGYDARWRAVRAGWVYR